MPKLSAGVLLYQTRDGVVEVLIAHPGGPFWARKDDGAWSIPKGEYLDGEDPLAAARREFEEELGSGPPAGDAADLGEIQQKSGKRVHGWAVAGDMDATQVKSNTFQFEWPPRSGKLIEIPEVDRVGWFAVAQARTKLLKGQRPFLDRLMAHPALTGSHEGT